MWPHEWSTKRMMFQRELGQEWCHGSTTVQHLGSLPYLWNYYSTSCGHTNNWKSSLTTNTLYCTCTGGPQRSPLKRTANDGGLDYTTDEAAKLILFSPSPPYGSFTPPASSPLGATKHTHRSNETGKPLPSKPAVTRSPPPPVAPKPKPQGATPSSSPPRRPKVTPGAVSIMPPGMASQVAAAARYKKRIPGGVRSEEEGVSPMVVRSGGREGDNPVSFDEVIQVLWSVWVIEGLSYVLWNTSLFV